MCKSIIKGALLGGIAIYLWTMISWMVLPWHCATLNHFKNEGEVTSVLRENVGTAGIYVAPSQKAASSEDSKKGEFDDTLIFVAISDKANQYKTPKPYISSFITDVIGAAFLALMLFKCSEVAYWKRVRVVMYFACALAVLGSLPQWTWWGFPSGYVAVDMADQIIGLFFAALILARIIPKSIVKS
ncbi:MAG: hypothetical protein KAR79_01200 [Simkaniaceae bacterium]|nr:hypothetical protein [Simkaniaceae bacterium]